jgi:hypothetical protein
MELLAGRLINSAKAFAEALGFSGRQRNVQP